MKEKKEEMKKEEPKFEKVETSKVKKEGKNEKKPKEKKVKIKTEGKKSKKAPAIIVAIIIVLILIALGIYMIFMQSTPTKTVEGMLQALKNSDYEKVNEYINYDELISSGTSEGENLNEEAQKLLFDKLSWNIKEVKKEADTSTVTVEITNKNFKTIINNYMQELLKRAFSGEQTSDQDIQNYLIEELKKEDVELTTKTQNINLVKQDGKWKISTENEELVNIILPGLTETINSLK